MPEERVFTGERDRALAAAESDRQALIYALGERVKELSFLAEAARLMQEQRPRAEVVAGLTARLAAAFEFPDALAARIRVADVCSATPGFQIGAATFSTTLLTAGGEECCIEVSYHSDKLPTPRDAFLPEEETLIATLGGMLKAYLERDQIQNERRVEREYLRHLVSASPAIIYSTDPAPPYNVRFVSENIRAQFGYDPAELLSGPDFWRSLIHEEDLPSVISSLDGLETTGTADAEYRLLDKSGSYRWIHTERTLVRDAQGRPAEVVGYAIDVTSRRAAEQAVVERERHFRRLIENISDMIGVIDPAGVITYQSPSVQSIIGFAPEEMIGRRAMDFVHPDDRDRVVHLFEEGLAHAQRIAGEFRHRHSDGSWVEVEAVATALTEEGRVLGAVITSRNVTRRRRLEAERLQLEERLRQSQKMEAVGRLAGGIAHDFNNLLTAILGYADLLLAEIPAGHPYHDDIDEIRRAGESAASLTRQLLAFSRRQILTPETLDLNAVVAELTRLLGRTIGEDIDLVTELDPRIGAVRADRGQIVQVLMNLSVNARDAMPRGGRLVIRTRPVKTDQLREHTRWSIPPGRYVLLQVSDTGAGMSPEVIAHLFEPFFTTKSVGKGTGLGLPTVYGIIAQSGGHIGIESEVGRGTEVFVYLPVVEAVPGAGPDGASRAERGDAKGRLLVVEDNATIRALAAQVLRVHGYEVVTAESGEEAEAIVATAAQPFDLLVTDVVMPGISGAELASRLQAGDPRLRCLFMSGYTDESLLQHGLESGHASFLQKPFTPAALRDAVRRVLGRPDPPPGLHLRTSGR